MAKKESNNPKVSVQPIIAPKRDAFSQFEEWGGKNWFPKTVTTNGLPKAAKPGKVKNGNSK